MDAKMDVKEIAWKIFIKYTELLAKRLSVNPTIEEVRKKVDELLKNDDDYQFLVNCQNNSESDVWFWAKTVGIDINDEVAEEFFNLRCRHGY